MNNYTSTFASDPNMQWWQLRFRRKQRKNFVTSRAGGKERNFSRVLPKSQILPLPYL